MKISKMKTIKWGHRNTAFSFMSVFAQLLDHIFVCFVLRIYFVFGIYNFDGFVDIW